MPTITVPLDNEVITRATAKLERYGLTVEEALGKFAADIAAGRGAIEYLEIPNEITRAALAEIEAGETKSFDTVEALMADLDAED